MSSEVVGHALNEPRSLAVSQPMHAPRILLVDDNAECRRTVARILRSQYLVTDVSTAEAALELLIYDQEFDAILCDMGLTGWSGEDLYKRLERRGNAHTSRFVALSGNDVREQWPELAAKLGERIVRKPVDSAALLGLLATVRVRAAA